MTYPEKWKTVPPLEELKKAHETLRAEFPDAKLTEMRLEFRVGERHDLQPSEEWSVLSWSVQVGNEHGSGASPFEAIAEVRKELDRQYRRPGYAERIAAILREIPDDGFERVHTLGLVQDLLNKERHR